MEPRALCMFAKCSSAELHTLVLKLLSTLTLITTVIVIVIGILMLLLVRM